MERKGYKVWADSDSKVDFPDNRKCEFDNYDDAYWCASELAHKHDGQPYRAIFHIEDLEIEETIDTCENIDNICDK